MSPRAAILAQDRESTTPRGRRGGEFLTHRLCDRLCGGMPTNLQIDDRLLAKAQKVGGFRTKKDTVNHALSEFVRRRQQKDIAGLFGTVDFAPDFDHKKLRAKRLGYGL